MSTVAAWPDHLLTLEEWAALEEETSHRYELIEGTLQVSPRPSPDHQWALSVLTREFHQQLPRWLRALPEVEVVLFDTQPPTVRVPDVIVVPTEKTRARPSRLAAADVLLVCEVLSPGSVRTDRITKLTEYADAGIPSYWIVDPTQSEPSVEVYQLGYAGYGHTTTAHGGTLTESTPVPITLALGDLHP